MTRANDLLAEKLRQSFDRDRVKVLNLVSSPGAGKTALIEQTLCQLKSRYAIQVVTTDPHTRMDCDRVLRAGAAAGIQINTRGGCHLDARMVRDALSSESVPGMDLIIIENVGNLLCPASWDLGQHVTAVVVSLPEGADIPFKYPEAFLNAGVLVITKQDMAPLVPYLPEQLRNNALTINPGLRVFEISCRTGSGLDAWISWLTSDMIRNPAPGSAHA